MKSIRAKITAITVSAILISILSVFAASFSSIQKENDRRSAETMRLLGENTKEILNEYFLSIEQSVEMAANIASDSLDSVILVEAGATGRSAGTEERTPEQKEMLDEYLADYCRQVQNAFSSVASHTHGVVTYYYCINPEISENEHGFFYSKVGKTGFDEQEPLDARTLDPEDIKHTTWYYTPIQRGRPSWVGPYTAHFLNEIWISSYLVPIYKSGALIGVLGMDIPLTTLIEQISEITIYDTGFACLIDENGKVIYHPELETGSELGAAYSLSKDVFSKESSGDRLISYTYNSEKRKMYFSTLNNGLKLVIMVPERELNAAWLRFVRIIALITLAVIAVYTFILLGIIGYITSPLHRLTEASKKLAAADYDVELDYHGEDEVGELTSAFSEMRDQIKLYIDDLNHRIHTDPLTELPNMRCFFDLAETETKRLKENGNEPVMLFFNLIGMKNYNRQYGFDEGDRLIISVSRILSAHFGNQAVGHFGQDYFGAVTKETGLEEELQAVLRECGEINGGKTLPVRIGVYPYRLETVSASVASDRAKYASDQNRSKYESGVYYFDAAMLEQAENVRYIISHIDQAIAEHWIDVRYQPIIRAVSGRVCDEEALSRWEDPERGLLSPSDFIPILEDARLIYKLDLYVVDQVLEKIRLEQEAGLSIVPHSINLSRSDFDACDIVEEIRKRVDDAGLPRNKITIEITESMIGSDFEFMKRQVERFRSLGFPVWMDDFGSGYSSLDVLQSIPFDLIKFDMSFTKRIADSEESRIILTELMKMAIALGVDTICEGVETAEQAQFLEEIGCSKLQGFYFCRAIPLKEILERYEKGIQIGYENSEESDYYSSIGRVNLYDLAVIASGEDNSFRKTFSSLPMCVLEVKGGRAELARTNQSFRDFMKRFYDIDTEEKKSGTIESVFGEESHLVKVLKQCFRGSNRLFFDEELPNGSIAHAFARAIAVNPVTGTSAAAIAVLSITDPDEEETYSRLAKALAKDYYNIYCVDLDTDRFTEYRSLTGEEGMAMERHGEHFFDEAKQICMNRIYEPDREMFLSVFTKENILRELNERGVFTTVYRLIGNDRPFDVSMKITRVQKNGNQIIVGISILDSQV
ncbi:MAG: EAL domain-containing protein [Solobacterium sp.]|nr:EAL domain-containing protein [Solobacterium sp.]